MQGSEIFQKLSRWKTIKIVENGNITLIELDEKERMKNKQSKNKPRNLVKEIMKLINTPKYKTEEYINYKIQSENIQQQSKSKSNEKTDSNMNMNISSQYENKKSEQEFGFLFNDNINNENENIFIMMNDEIINNSNDDELFFLDFKYENNINSNNENYYYKYDNYSFMI